ncbi:hypothetical protein MKW94_003585, partial [Papaver nudicaule]|nr:hypothetical protein [Papaver nudicaule]
MVPLAPRSGDAIFANVERVVKCGIVYGARVSQLLTDLDEVEEVNNELHQILVVTNWDADGTSCSLVLEDNPLVDFVELPEHARVYIIAMSLVSMETEVTWVRDMLRGDDIYELRVSSKFPKITLTKTTIN